MACRDPPPTHPRDVAAGPCLPAHSILHAATSTLHAPATLHGKPPTRPPTAPHLGRSGGAAAAGRALARSAQRARAPQPRAHVLLAQVRAVAEGVRGRARGRRAALKHHQRCRRAGGLSDPNHTLWPASSCLCACAPHASELPQAASGTRSFGSWGGRAPTPVGRAAHSLPARVRTCSSGCLAAARGAGRTRGMLQAQRARQRRAPGERRAQEARALVRVRQRGQVLVHLLAQLRAAGARPSTHI